MCIYSINLYHCFGNLRNKESKLFHILFYFSLIFYISLSVFIFFANCGVCACFFFIYWGLILFENTFVLFFLRGGVVLEKNNNKLCHVRIGEGEEARMEGVVGGLKFPP